MAAVPMKRLAAQCAKVWRERDALDRTLLRGIDDLPYARFLYAMTPDGRQISSNSSREGLLPEEFGRDRSHRPYMQQVVPESGFLLSDAYISMRAGRPSLTAVQKVETAGTLLGYLGADFDLRDLPLTRELYKEPLQWRQMKGDPAIRGALFLQTRAESLLDRQIEQVLPLLEELICDHGVFHCKIHFSSSRASVWQLDDPYSYRMLDFDSLIDPDICLAYPQHPYPQKAVIPQGEIRAILQTMRELRFADEVIYLRAGSLNLFNGLIGLTFSCDGSHYISYSEFLTKDSPFWRGLGRL